MLLSDSCNFGFGLLLFSWNGALSQSQRFLREKRFVGIIEHSVYNDH